MAGFPDLVTFDVGGTSTDVSLIHEGRPLFTSNRQVAGYPVKTPMVDIHVIGAGGGSIAWLDDSGSLKVGPQSAGAVPGPVGYGRGGTLPTITDAMFSLQRLNPECLLKGKMAVHAAAARAVIMEKVAAPLGLTLEAAAEGIIRIANANMSRAIRSVSTERGYELSRFALFAYGGAGPLHALDVARECGIPIVIIPQEPGTMCARGMLLTDISFDFVESDIAPVDASSWHRITDKIAGLVGEAAKWLDGEGVDANRRSHEVVVEARYVGQNFEVQVALDRAAETGFKSFEAGFHAAHLREYGYNVPDRAIEVINCRVKAIGQVVKAPLRKLPAKPAPAASSRREIYFGPEHGWLAADVYDRDLLGAGTAFTGPMAIEEMSSTTVIGPGQHVRVDDYGNLIVRISCTGS
jgi:N-methylhydantoinase A